MSGFPLSRPFLVEARGRPHVHRGVYLQLRALRILPAYYVSFSSAPSGPWGIASIS